MTDKREVNRDLLHAREHLEKCKMDFIFAYNILNKAITRELKKRRHTDEASDPAEEEKITKIIKDNLPEEV